LQQIVMEGEARYQRQQNCADQAESGPAHQAHRAGEPDRRWIYIRPQREERRWQRGASELCSESRWTKGAPKTPSQLK
jgi:hypothetical protein